MLALVLALIAASPPSLTVPFSDRLPAGSVAWMTVVVPLAAPPPPDRPLEARVLGGDLDPQLTMLPFPRVVDASRGRARVEVPVRVAADAAEGGRHTLRGTVAVGAGSGGPVGRARVERRVRVGPAEPRSESVADLERTHDAWLTVARTAAGRGTPDPEAEVQARAALEILRRRAQTGSSPDARSALARAALAWPPADVAAGSSIEIRLQGAERAVREARYRRARDLLRSVRRSGTARPLELARALTLLGILEHLRGRRSAADTALGQAVCLAPELPPPDLPDPLLAVVAGARAASRCAERIGVGPIEATWVRTEDGLELEVRVPVVEDRFRLVRSVEIDRFQLGGAASTGAAPPQRDGPTVLRFPAQLREASSPVLLRGRLLDAHDNVVSAFGEPDPIRVSPEGGVDDERSGLPAWALWVGGAALLVGGAVAVGLAVDADDDIQRGIGPMTVSF